MANSERRGNLHLECTKTPSWVHKHQNQRVACKVHGIEKGKDAPVDERPHGHSEVGAGLQQRVHGSLSMSLCATHARCPVRGQEAASYAQFISPVPFAKKNHLNRFASDMLPLRFHGSRRYAGRASYSCATPEQACIPLPPTPPLCHCHGNGMNQMKSFTGSIQIFSASRGLMLV